MSVVIRVHRGAVEYQHSHPSGLRTHVSRLLEYRKPEIPSRIHLNIRQQRAQLHHRLGGLAVERRVGGHQAQGALAALQARLLDALWPLLKPGGRLLYATCSVFRCEGQAQIDAFLQRHGAAAAALHPASPGHLLTVPDNPGEATGSEVLHDGFYLALIRKT